MRFERARAISHMEYMKKTRWGPVTTYKWIEVITPINDLLNGFHWGYNYPFFRGVTVTLLIKMIFQLIGRFFFGAKIFLKTKKNKPLPFARDPIPPGDPTRGRPFPERATSCQAIAIKL